ncbi:quinoprotein relay system zinc metallohydrolase 2 [Beijerinckia sp. L45]|uniref:quinoprotein relay system zinc metallohydrolase 2 n=1 Tax=Beijerinckia sp. L45 TaxID=1641855 RepID=UPI00131AB462|nr:quinoprotein relay system zinc metallohydrolase 2 [Beijerinckia sp. L45]
MRLDRREALLGTFCLCCLPTLGRAADFKLEEVAPGVFVRRGVDQDATPSNLDAIANIGCIVGRDAVLVTESGGSLADGQWLRQAIKAKTDKPIKYVVLSHVHPDHIFGAAAFTADHPTFIGHAKLREALQQRGEFYRTKLSEVVGVDKVGPIVMPTRAIADAGEVDLGGRVIRFKAHGPAHTSCDLSMVDTQTGLLLPADLLFVARVPSLDGSLLGWLKEIDVLKAMGAAKAVPGHGPTSVDFAGTSADLVRYLTVLRDGVRAEIKKNGSIETAIKTVGQDEKSRWLLFDDYNARNVTQAYKELEWE